MKFFIVLALLGAVFADEEIDPVMVADLPLNAHEMIDFGIAYIPESVLREVGYERQPGDDRMPVHFVNANGDIESFVDDAAEQIDPVQIVDIVPQAMEGDAPVETELVNDGPVEGSVHIVDNAENDEDPFKVRVVELPLEEIAPQESNPEYRGKLFPSPLMR